MEGLAVRKLILHGDWTFVTRNSIDFRGPRDAFGSKGQYADVALHARADMPQWSGWDGS